MMVMYYFFVLLVHMCSYIHCNGIHNSTTNVNQQQQQQHVTRSLSGVMSHEFKRKTVMHPIIDPTDTVTPATTNSNIINIIFDYINTIQDNHSSSNSDSSTSSITSKVINELSSIDFSNETSIHTSELATELYRSIGSKVLHKEAPMQEYIDNFHNVSFYHLVDIILTFDKYTDITGVFSNWQPAIEGYHLIIMVDDEITCKKTNALMPHWSKDWEIYTLSDIRKALDTEINGNMQWLLDEGVGFDTQSSLRNCAIWVGDRELYYIVSNGMMPARPDLIREHVRALKTPSTGEYFNYQTDPFSPGNDFHYGYPFHLRGGNPTAVSQGVLPTGDTWYDPITKVMKPSDIATSDTAVSSPVTVAYGQLYSMFPGNIMYSRELLGPSMIFLPTTGEFESFANYADVYSGWIVKTVADSLRIGVKVGGNTHVTRVPEDEYTSHIGLDPLHSEFQSNGSSLVIHDQLYRFFYNYELNATAQSKSPFCGGRWLLHQCVLDNVIDMMDYTLGPINPLYQRLSRMLKVQLYAWDSRHGFLNFVVPVSSKSSRRPAAGSHGCASLTISHNEKIYFPIWLRYYMRHFEATDIYVLDHNTDDGSLDNLPAGVHLQKMEGNKYAMPVQYRSLVIKIWIDRLLRSGYKCVVFSDTDEIVAANPLVYHRGLADYLRRFTSDNVTDFAMRVTAIEVAHMAYGNGSISTQEPTMDWSKSLLAQRHFMVPDRVYNKPLLTKRPMAYKPGFHNFYSIHWNRAVAMDENLVMFHIRSVDYTTCLHRESLKFNMTRAMETAELHRGYASHWNLYEKDKKTGELCKYANACFQGPLHAATKFWDNTGTFPVQRLDPKWNLVDL